MADYVVWRQEEDTGNEGVVTLDPFPTDTHGESDPSAIEYPEPLDITQDLPDGLEQEVGGGMATGRVASLGSQVWDRLVEVRDEKIEVEIDIKRKAIMLGSLNRRLHTLNLYESQAQAKCVSTALFYSLIHLSFLILYISFCSGGLLFF